MNFAKGRLFTKFLHAEMNVGCNVSASNAEMVGYKFLPKQPICKNFDPSILPNYMVLIVLWVIIV